MIPIVSSIISRYSRTRKMSVQFPLYVLYVEMLLGFNGNNLVHVFLSWVLFNLSYWKVPRCDQTVLLSNCCSHTKLIKNKIKILSSWYVSRSIFFWLYLDKYIWLQKCRIDKVRIILLIIILYLVYVTVNKIKCLKHEILS